MLDREDTALGVRQAAGITQSTWYHRMAHPDTWRLGELRRVAEALDVPLASLVTVDD